MILRKAYEMLGLKTPWHFRADRDVRTLVALGRSLDIELTPANREGTHHHALEQIEKVHIIMLWMMLFIK
jgi:exodeoxyribonuclease VIII